MARTFKGFTTMLVTILMISVSGLPTDTYAKDEKKGKQPKNVILLIGDGMGPEYNSAYRHYVDNKDTKDIERTRLDKHLIGQMSTDPDNGDKENITDSAAAGTALATGEKTYNGAISVNKNQQPRETVLEKAKAQKKSTGLVVTSELTDATPASFAAHENDRDNKNEIAQDFYNEKIDDQHKVDVLLGGGAKYFGKENDQLDKKFEKDGYAVAHNKDELAKAKGDKVLGLFADENLPYMIDRDENVPSLADMTTTALDKLNKNDEGFFLMIEGSQIDKAAHPNDATGVMSEMEDFDKAFEKAMNFAEKDGDTLVLVTADHATGGMSMGTRGVQSYNPEIIHDMKHSAVFMAEQVMAGKDVDAVIKDGYGFELTEKEQQKIKKAAEKVDTKKQDDYKVQSALEAALVEPVNKRSNTGWTTDKHVGHDVNVYGYGPDVDNYKGVIDNTTLSQNIAAYYGK